MPAAPPRPSQNSYTSSSSMIKTPPNQKKREFRVQKKESPCPKKKSPRKYSDRLVTLSALELDPEEAEYPRFSGR